MSDVNQIEPARRVSRWVMAVGIAGTVLLAMGAFSLSFTALMHLAIRCGVNPRQAWEWPLIVDGVIVVATVSVVALGGRRGTGYAWGLLVGAALVSVGGNVAQAIRLPTQEPSGIAAAVAVIPPLVLLAATHMSVILTRPAPHPPSPTPELAASCAEPASTAEDQLPGQGASDHQMPASGQLVAVLPAIASRERLGDEVRTLKVNKARSLRVAGWSIKQIADELGVTPGSVRRYLKPVLSDSEQIGDIL